MSHWKTGVTVCLAAAGALVLSSCGDGLFTEPAAGTGAPTLDEILVDGAPTCQGLPATIWVGMDPALLPEGASIEEREHEESHTMSTAASESGETHDGCSCGGDEGSHARWVIIGTDDDDVIVGSTTPDSIAGLGGEDVICARQASDVIRGGEGEDIIHAGPGADWVYGEDGDDFLFGGPGRDRLWGADGDDQISGGAGRDDLFGEDGDDTLLGGMGPDSLDGGAGDNFLDPGPQECSGEEGGEGGHEGGGCGGGGGCDGGHDDGGMGSGGMGDEGGCDHTDGGCTH